MQLKMFQLLGFMFGWLTFYHQGHEVAKDFKPYMTELQLKIQKVGGQFIYCFTFLNCLNIYTYIYILNNIEKKFNI